MSNDAYDNQLQQDKDEMNFLQQEQLEKEYEDRKYMKELIDRIKQAYNKNKPLENTSELWKWCLSHANAIEINEANLENMANTDLIWGFFGGTQSGDTLDAIKRLAQAVGVCGIQNPENGPTVFPKANAESFTADELLDLIQTKLPFTINLPKFIGNRTSHLLETKYGQITDRHVHYLWVLKRIIELCPNRNARILEIGAGMGLLGYYLDKAGYKDYTTIDLAHVNACQAYFLGKNLPDREFLFSDINPVKTFREYVNSFKIFNAALSDNILNLKYDIIINIDGLTEYPYVDARHYFTSDCAPLFLSINHEVNDFRVCEIDPKEEVRTRLYRYPFWLRPGYVEELFKLK